MTYNFLNAQTFYFSVKQELDQEATYMYLLQESGNLTEDIYFHVADNEPVDLVEDKVIGFDNRYDI